MGNFDFTLPGSDPATPNTFVRTPDQIARMQALAAELSKNGSDYSPVQSPWQGAARIAQALSGAILNSNADRAQRLASADATADQSNVFNRNGIFNDPSEAAIPATPGQTTPALQANDAINDAATDAPDKGLSPRAAALAAAIGGGSPPAPMQGNAALANAISAPPQAPSKPDPMMLAAALGNGTPYGTSNVSGGGTAPGGGSMLAGVNPDARGMRNNNPGNLEANAWTASLPGYVGTDGRFAIFNSPQAGQAALDKNLAGYGHKGIATPLAIASTWAPGSEQGNNPNSYGAAIARQLGVGLTDHVDMSDPATRAKIGQAIALVENGRGRGASSPAVAAINAATAQPSPALGASPGGPQGASAYAPGPIDRLSPDAAASPLARPAMPSSTPTPSAGDFGQLRTAMNAQPTPYTGGMSGQPGADPAKSISPSHETAPLSTQPEHGDIGGLLRVASNPWTSPAGQQVASGLLANQMPTRPTLIDGPNDPDTGYATKLLWSPTQGVLGRLNPDGSISPVGAGGGAASSRSGATIIPPGMDPKKYRETLAERGAAEATPSASDELKFAQSIRETPSYKELAQAVPTYNSMVTKHITNNSPAADKAIVDDFAKILNPGRSVTTGAFVLNLDAQSLPAELAAKIQKVWNGDGELGPDARAQMAQIAQDKVMEYKRAWDVDAAQATETARAHHHAVERVVPQFPDLASLDLSKINSTKTMASPAKATAAPSAQPDQMPSIAGAKQAPDGNWYVPDPARPGKFLMVH